MKPLCLGISIKSAISSREYFFDRFGLGLRYGWPPMSATRSEPPRPSAARGNGALVKSGHASTETETSLKLSERPALMEATSSSIGGGGSSSLTTGQVDIFDSRHSWVE